LPIEAHPPGNSVRKTEVEKSLSTVYHECRPRRVAPARAPIILDFAESQFESTDGHRPGGYRPNLLMHQEFIPDGRACRSRSMATIIAASNTWYGKSETCRFIMPPPS
jgi:hypothetical protein